MSFIVCANVSTAVPKRWVSHRYHCRRPEQLQFFPSLQHRKSPKCSWRGTFQRSGTPPLEQCAAASSRSGTSVLSREHSTWPRRSEDVFAAIVSHAFCISNAKNKIIASCQRIHFLSKCSSFSSLGLEGRDRLGCRRKFHFSCRQGGRYICAGSSSGVDNEETSNESGFENMESEVRQAIGGNTCGELEDSPCEVWVVNFYHFVDIEDPHLEVARHTSFMEGRDVRGRIYISYQGINAQLSGPGQEALEYAQWVKEDLRFSNMLVQISYSPKGHAFPRLRLRYKPSLVQVEGGTLHLPITEPSSRAVQLTPEEWIERLEAAPILGKNNIVLSQELQSPKTDSPDDSSINTKRPIVLLDVRNGYEWDVGHFKGAQRPHVDCFKSTDFGLIENEPLGSDPLANVDKEAVDVMMYCTGGIRCDVFSTMLRQRGFRNLYSLKGGVSNYLKEEGPQKWVGNLFVFDSRLAVSPKVYHSEETTERGSIPYSDTAVELDCAKTSTSCTFARCSLCGNPISEPRHRNCANLDCNALHLSCGQCLTQHKGCCCGSCSLSTKLRPLLVSQQYERWHKYRPEEPKIPQPNGYVSRRALKRRRRKEQRKKLSGATTHGQLSEPILEKTIS